MTHDDRALSPADLFGGKAPVGALIGLSGANLLAHMQLKCILCASLAAVYLPFFLSGIVLSTILKHCRGVVD